MYCLPFFDKHNLVRVLLSLKDSYPICLRHSILPVLSRAILENRPRKHISTVAHRIQKIHVAKNAYVRNSTSSNISNKNDVTNGNET